MKIFDGTNLFDALAHLGVGMLISLAAVTGANAADAEATKPAHSGQHIAHWQQHREQWEQQKLTRAANRLEIKASQQAAWDEYAAARKGLMQRPEAKPDGQSKDAAAVARHHAERATQFAQRLTVLAEATAKLQATLTPEQQKTLNQIALHGDGHRHGRHHFHHGRHHGHHHHWGHDRQMHGNHQGQWKHESDHGAPAKSGKPTAPSTVKKADAVKN
jgi:hypothetical protein